MKNKLWALAAAGLIFLGQQTVLFGNYYNGSCSEACMNGWYAGASGSVSWHNDIHGGNFSKIETKTGYGGNLAIGYLVEMWRLELEGSLRFYKNKNFALVNGPSINDSGHLRDLALCLNLKYDIPFSSCFGAYLGAGAGIGQVRLELDNNILGDVTSESTKFVYQFMGGFVYDINSCWAITLGYCYFAMAKPCLITTTNQKHLKLRKIPFSNNVDLGLRFKF